MNAQPEQKTSKLNEFRKKLEFDTIFVTRSKRVCRALHISIPLRTFGRCAKVTHKQPVHKLCIEYWHVCTAHSNVSACILVHCLSHAQHTKAPCAGMTCSYKLILLIFRQGICMPKISISALLENFKGLLCIPAYYALALKKFAMLLVF